MEYLVIINLENSKCSIEPAPIFDGDNDYSDDITDLLIERYSNISSISWGIVKSITMEI